MPGQSRSLVVAVDGPSGSGKSSVSREVARRLGLAYLDTGAMYRAVAWSCLARGIDLSDQVAVADVVRTFDLRLSLDPAAQSVVVDGEDVTAPIRESRISGVVSAVATNLDVRSELRRQQREIIAGTATGWGGCVAEGRDITTVVSPDADVRVLLTASEEARLARRATELHGTASADAVQATRDEVVRRDADDSTVASFTVAADGVVLVDSSALDFEQTVQALLDVVASVVAGSLELDPSEIAGVRT